MFLLEREDLEPATWEGPPKKMMAFENDVAGCRKTCPKFGVASVEGCISKTVRIHRNFDCLQSSSSSAPYCLGKPMVFSLETASFSNWGSKPTHILCKQSYL